MLNFLICLLITVMIHEYGHMWMALRCGMGVKAFSLGFGKPYLHKTVKGIDYRLSPLPLGGYCDIQGMDSKESPKDFGSHPYWQRFLVLIAGVAVNLAMACICYLINYGSIKLGMAIDIELIKAIFTKDYSMVDIIFRQIQPNFFLIQLSLLNFFTGLSNLIPIFPLDGGWIWYTLIEEKLSKGIKNFLNISGWVSLVGIQLYLVYYIYFI